MGKLTFYCLILLGAILASCTKDPSLNDCIDIPQSPIGTYNYSMTGAIGYHEPCYKPGDANQILFIEGSDTSSISEIYTYNLLTKQKQLIYTLNISASTVQLNPSYGRNGLILLNLNGNVWRVKEDGSGLTQLTFSGNLNAPAWDSAADKFAVTSKNSHLIIFNQNGNPLDTLKSINLGDSPNPFINWQNPKYLLMGLSIIDPVKDTVIGEANLANNNQYHGETLNLWSGSTCLYPDYRNVVFLTSEGVYRINIMTDQVTAVKQSCTSKGYLNMTYSPISGKFIFERRDEKMLSNGTVAVAFNLFFMNPDGTGEQQIQIAP